MIAKRLWMLQYPLMVEPLTCATVEPNSFNKYQPRNLSWQHGPVLCMFGNRRAPSCKKRETKEEAPSHPTPQKNKHELSLHWGTCSFRSSAAYQFSDFKTHGSLNSCPAYTRTVTQAQVTFPYRVLQSSHWHSTFRASNMASRKYTSHSSTWFVSQL